MDRRLRETECAGVRGTVRAHRTLAARADRSQAGQAEVLERGRTLRADRTAQCLAQRLRLRLLIANA